MIEDKNIRNTIRELREGLDISQAKIATAIGIRTSTYANVENGPTEIIYKHLPDIARELGTSVERLILGYEPCNLSESELHSEANYKEMMASMRKDYEDRIEEMVNTIADMKEEIDSLKEDKRILIASQDFILSRKK